MKLLQQDDILDSFSNNRKEFRFIHLPTKKIVRSETKSIAIAKFKINYNLIVKRKEVRQAQINE